MQFLDSCMMCQISRVSIVKVDEKQGIKERDKDDESTTIA